MKKGMKIQKVENPPYRIDVGKLERYDQRKLIFNRVFMDPEFPYYQRTEEIQGLKNIQENKPGYTRIDYALAEASWTVHDTWVEAFNWTKLERPYGPSLMGERWNKDRYQIEDRGKVTGYLKRAARFYGASLVGITDLNEKWIYANNRRNLEPLKLPEDIQKVFVLAIEMDELGIATSPHAPAAAATGLGYSKMAFLCSILAEFIRNLGFEAIPAGNDTGLSIPLAIDAGLGQIGRNGLLITPEYGPRIRLCKIFTDLPLIPDLPIDFGVTEFCRECKLCAEACKADAISKETEPSWQPSCASNNPGALKWYVNSEKCYSYWCENGIDCSTCIAVCPYNPSENRKAHRYFWDQQNEN
jgi:hypothetical protein